MVKYICILLFSVFIFSCASQKKSDKHLSASSISDIDLNIKKEMNSGLSQIDWSKFFESEDIEIYIRRYDTTAKADSTGNYPLKEEETRKSKRNTEKEQQTTTDATKQENSETNYKADNQTKIEQTEKKESSTEVGSPFNLNWLWLLIIPTIGFFIYKKFILKK